jgi:transposase
MRDDQWAVVESLVKPKHGVGGKPVDYRKLVDGIRWVLHSGAHWQDMPRTYGAGLASEDAGPRRRRYSCGVVLIRETART